MATNQAQGASIGDRIDDVSKREFEDLADNVDQIRRLTDDQNAASVRIYQQMYATAGRLDENTDIHNRVLAELVDIAAQIRPGTPPDEDTPPQRAILERMFEIMRANDPHLTGIDNESRAIRGAVQRLIEEQRTTSDNEVRATRQAAEHIIESQRIMSGNQTHAITQASFLLVEEQRNLNQYLIAAIRPGTPGTPAESDPAQTAILQRMLEEMRADDPQLTGIHAETRGVRHAINSLIEEERDLGGEVIAAIIESTSSTMRVAEKLLFFAIVFALGFFIAHYMKGDQAGPTSSIPYGNLSIEQAAERASSTLSNILGQNPQWNTIFNGPDPTSTGV